MVDGFNSNFFSNKTKNLDSNFFLYPYNYINSFQ